MALEAPGLTDVLPGDVADFLQESARLNALRNEAIAAQCEALVAGLNAAGLRPILLKGGAHLYMKGTARRSRMMVDLDLLVAQGDLMAAVAVADRLGYRVVREHEAWEHDYHILGREGEIATLEFHKTVGQQRHLLSVEDAFRRAVPLATSGVEALVLDPTDRALHNIFHAAIQDRAHHLGRIPLRALHDLGLIRVQSDDAIDWERIAETMTAAGYGGVLPAYLHMAQELLGQPLPQAVAPGPGARAHLARCRLLRRARPLRSAMELWATITHPFARAHFEYLHGPAPSALALQRGRARLAAGILTKHRHRLVGKLAQEYRKLYRLRLIPALGMPLRGRLEILAAQELLFGIHRKAAAPAPAARE